MKIILLALALSLSGCAVIDSHNVIGRQIPPRETFEPLTLAERTETAALVWSTIDARYIDPGMNGVDWKRVREDYLPKLSAAMPEMAYWELMDKMVGELGDSHTRVENPSAVRDRNASGGPSYGLALSKIENELVVLSVHPESDAWFAGVRAGMIVESIDKLAAMDRFTQVLGESRKQSTEAIRERQALRRMLRAEKDTSVAVKIGRGDGTSIEATLKSRVHRSPPSMMSRTLPSGYGYIRFSGFSESLRERVLAAITELKDTPGLVIDLRGNGGGSGAMSQAIVERFMSKEATPVKWTTRGDAPVRVLGIAVTEDRNKFKPAGKTAYTNPVVILTDLSSASASELTASALRELGNTRVVGQTTCGCLLGFMGHAKLKGGAELAYSEIGFISASGKRVEREGVVPDVVVAQSPADLRAARDRVLEAGVAELARMTSKAQ
jgi:carboxyl-terminal processing protease